MLYLRPITGSSVVTKYNFWVDFLALFVSQILIYFSSGLFMVFNAPDADFFLELQKAEERFI